MYKALMIILALAITTDVADARSRHHSKSHTTRFAKSKPRRPILETGAIPKTVAELTPDLIRKWVLTKDKTQ